MAQHDYENERLKAELRKAESDRNIFAVWVFVLGFILLIVILVWFNGMDYSH